jgi:hypothetical protein
MDGGPQTESELRERVHEREGASEGPRRRIERGKDAVTRPLDETAVEPLDLVPRRLVVSIEDPAPIPIPHGSRAARRVDDVREQDGVPVPIAGFTGIVSTPPPTGAAIAGSSCSMLIE